MSFVAVEKLIMSKSNEAYAKKVLKMFFKAKYSNTIRIGLRNPECRELAKEIVKSNEKIYKNLIMDDRHEFRTIGLMMMLELEKKQNVLDDYLELLDYVTNWDLVDSSAGIAGRALLKFIEDLNDVNEMSDSTTDVLSTLPEWYQQLFNSRSLWKVRVSIVSLLQILKIYPLIASRVLIKKIAQMTDDGHTLELNGLPFEDMDLIHKSIGWVLREIGKVNQKLLIDILTAHSSQMAKVTVSYAVERLPKSTANKFKKR
jgi:3-methyladenine DNA glycosylase AlkD